MRFAISARVKAAWALSLSVSHPEVDGLVE